MPRLEGDEGRRAARAPYAEVIEAGELELDAVAALLADEAHAVARNVAEHDGEVLVDEGVGEVELPGILKERRHLAEIVDAGLVDRGDSRGPGLREDQLVVIERLALRAGDGDVEGGVASKGERQVNVAGVRHLERLRQRGSVNRVGHVQLEVEGVGLAGLGGGEKLEGHAVLAGLGDLVVVKAGDAVSLKADGALRASRLVADEAADDGEEDGRASGPELGVSLPQILGVAHLQAHELSSHGVDRRGKPVFGNRRQSH